jgi:excisionase family DNA binding protein
MERLTVGEAAERLGISKQAVRKRVQRGTLPHVKQSDGHVYVYLDSETRPMEQKAGVEDDRQTTLNYIDKLYISWQSLLDSQRRFVLLLLADSILVLALSGGAVFTEETLTIFSVGFRVPLVIFMVTGAVLLPLFINGGINTLWLATLYEHEIVSLYKRLGLAGFATNSPIDPFSTGGFQKAITTGYRIQMKTTASEDGTPPTPKPTINVRRVDYLIALPLTILPAAAQTGAGYKISELLRISGSLKESNVGWSWEAFAYVGEALAFILAHLYLPRQGSDWISDFFVVLAFLTVLLFIVKAMQPSGSGLLKVAIKEESTEQSKEGSEEEDGHPIKRHIKAFIKGVEAGLEGNREELRARATPRQKLLVYLFVASALSGPLTWMGVWLGYLVAAS